jgi:hypothetical protein
LKTKNYSDEMYYDKITGEAIFLHHYPSYSEEKELVVFKYGVGPIGHVVPEKDRIKNGTTAVVTLLERAGKPVPEKSIRYKGYTFRSHAVDYWFTKAGPQPMVKAAPWFFWKEWRSLRGEEIASKSRKTGKEEKSDDNSEDDDSVEDIDSSSDSEELKYKKELKHKKRQPKKRQGDESNEHFEQFDTDDNSDGVKDVVISEDTEIPFNNIQQRTIIEQLSDLLSGMPREKLLLLKPLFEKFKQ